MTAFLLGCGTTPATVMVAYDRMDEAASYELYVREHEAGTDGTDALQTRGAYEAGLQARGVAAEMALRAASGRWWWWRWGAAGEWGRGLAEVGGRGATGAGRAACRGDGLAGDGSQ